MRKRKFTFKPLSVLGWLIVLAYTIILTVPLYFIIITAFKTEAERIVNPIGLPIHATLENFGRAWVEGNLTRATFNSVVISGGIVILLLCNVILVSYCLNRIRDTKISSIIQTFLVCCTFIPGTAGIATSLMIRRDLGLYNNLGGEIFCNSLVISTAVFMTIGFLRSIPRDLEEAAMIDGANDFHICTKVIVPVIKPILTTITVQTFTDTWNAYLNRMLTLRDEKLYTIPMALAMNFSKETSVDYTATFAAVLITCIPLGIVFLKGQKYFESGMAGSVKG